MVCILFFNTLPTPLHLLLKTIQTIKKLKFNARDRSKDKPRGIEWPNTRPIHNLLAKGFKRRGVQSLITIYWSDLDSIALIDMDWYLVYRELYS
jgi:hypothetical protein